MTAPVEHGGRTADEVWEPITAGSAVSHVRAPLVMIGRVRYVLPRGKAAVTWCRRSNLSVCRIENLRPISDAELVAHFHQQEEMYERFWQATKDDPEMVQIGPPARTSLENRAFLLGPVPHDGRDISTDAAGEEGRS